MISSSTLIGLDSLNLFFTPLGERLHSSLWRPVIFRHDFYMTIKFHTKFFTGAVILCSGSKSKGLFRDTLTKGLRIGTHGPRCFLTPKWCFKAIAFCLAHNVIQSEKRYFR